MYVLYVSILGNKLQFCTCFTDDFIPSRQRRFLNNNNAANASQTKGNALEIARQFRMQKQKTSTVSKVAPVSKVVTVSKVVKSIATDNLSNAQLGMFVCMCVHITINTIRYSCV